MLDRTFELPPGAQTVRRDYRVDGVEDVSRPVRWTIRPRGPAGSSEASRQDGLQTGAMALPEIDVARIRRWCAARVLEAVRDQVRVEADVTDRHVTIVECRPPWRADFGPEWTRFPIARLRYTQASKQWSLNWRDRNLRFHEYDRVPPTGTVEDLLTEVDRDPTAIFWG